MMILNKSYRLVSVLVRLCVLIVPMHLWQSVVAQGQLQWKVHILETSN